MDMDISEQRMAVQLSTDELHLVECVAERMGVSWEQFLATAGVEKAARMVAAEQLLGSTIAFMPVI
jgi:uncharacterized protein (DUF1778 family)